MNCLILLSFLSILSNVFSKVHSVFPMVRMVPFVELLHRMVVFRILVVDRMVVVVAFDLGTCAYGSDAFQMVASFPIHGMVVFQMVVVVVASFPIRGMVVFRKEVVVVVRMV